MMTEEFSDQSRDFFLKIQNGDVEGVCEFIDDKNKSIAPFDNKNNESSAAVALKSKQLAVYEALISRAWCLNSNENFNEIVDNLKQSLRKEIRGILKEFIKNPDEGHLKTLIENLLDQNRYISFTNAEEGKLLLADNIKSTRKKNIENIITQFHEALKCELREIHKRNFIKNPNEEHLTALITRTSIYFGGSSATTNRPKYLEIIAGAYEQLNEVKEIQTIFKVVANIKNLNIIFDFDHDSVQHADATGNENVYGKSYAETGEVYLGAKALKESNRSEKFSEDNSETVDSEHDDVNQAQVLGVLAHELCHVAIFRIYNNNYKPYHKDDSENEKEFESVLHHCLENPYIEEIIALALKGSKDLMYDELCVRVPHLLALYQGDNEKINSLRETFKKLFDYFEMKTLPDFEKEIDLMSAVWKLKSKEPQHLTDSKIFINPRTLELDLCKDKVIEISSNCPEITMNWIFQETTSKSNSNFLFLDLKHLKDEETFELMIDAHSSCMKPSIVIDCDNETREEIVKIVEEIKNDGIKKRIIFVHDRKESLIKDVTAIKISHSWLDLAEESKKNLIKMTMNFQGQEMVLEEVIDRFCDALDFVPLKELLSNNLKIGNEIKFPEIDIHVQRKFRNKKYEKIDPSQLLNIAESSKLILLSDDPGMGKTTELKMLALNFKDRFKSSWVAFTDLKEYSEFYEKDEKFKTEFNSSEEIANFFVQKIFKLNEFEGKVFKRLFCSNRVVLLFDGFDEISPSFKKFVTMLIKSIKKHSSNILITSTRLHLKDELCKEFEVEAYTFMHLTWDNCEEILELKFEKYGIKEEDLELKIDQTYKFFKNLTQEYEIVRNPLILRMLAKIFSDDQFAKDTQPNTFSIYENFIKTLIMDSMIKGDDARQEATSCIRSEFNINRFYQKEAFSELFKNYYQNEFKSLSDLCFSDVKSPAKEQITRIALMKSDGSGKFQFIHRTFAEFFVAEFFIKNIFDSKALEEWKQKDSTNKERLELVFKIFREVFRPNGGSFRGLFFTVRSFIVGAFENMIPKIEVLGKEFLISIFPDVFTRDKLPEYFRCFVTENLIDFISAITRCADKVELKRIWIEQKYEVNKDTNIFMFAANKGSLSFNKKLIALAREFLDEKDFKTFFSEKNLVGETVVSFAFENSREVFDLYIPFSPSPYDQFPDTELYLKTKYKLTQLIKRSDLSEFQDELERIEENHGLEYLQRFLNSWTIGRSTFYLHICHYSPCIEKFGKLWNSLRNILDGKDFKTLLNKSDRDGTTPLMYKAEQYRKGFFISFWRLLSKGLTKEETENILIEEDEEGTNLFDYAAKCRYHQTFLAIKDLCLKTFEKERISIMLTRERKYGRSCLFYAVTWGSLKTTKALWEFIQEIYDLSNQKAILMKTNKSGWIYFGETLMIPDFNEKKKIFDPFIEQHFSESEKEQNKYDPNKYKPD